MKRTFLNTVGKWAGLILLMAMTCSMALSAFAENEALDYTLYNKSGKTIAIVYMRETGTKEWSDDWLIGYVLEDNQESKMNFNADRDAQYWDIKIIFEDETTFWSEGFDMYNVVSMTVKTRKDGKSYISYANAN